MTFLLRIALGLALFWGGSAVAQGPGRIPMRVMGPEDGLANPLVNCMAQSGDGYIWVGTWSGLFRTDGHRFEWVNWAPSGTVVDLAVDGEGQLWVASDRGLGVRRDGVFHVLGPREGLPVEGVYRRLLATPDGLFLIREGFGYRSAKGDHWTLMPPLDLGDLVDLTWAPQHGGVLALGAQSLGRVSDASRIGVPTLAKGDAFAQVVEDAEGSLWLLSRQGLWRQKHTGGAWQDVRNLVPSGVPFRMNGGIGGGVVLHHPTGARWVVGEKVEIYPRQEFQSAPGVGASLLDREGALWLGAYGVQRTLGGGLWRVYGVAEGLPAPGAWGYLRDRKGRLWVGNGQGLCMATSTGWKTLLPGKQILSVSEDVQGGIWATGGPQDAVHWIHPDTLAITSFQLPTSVPTQFRAVVPSAQGDQVWVFPRWQVPGWAFFGERVEGRWVFTPVKTGGQTVTGVNYIARAPDGRTFMTAPGGVYELQGAQAQLVIPRPPEWVPQYLAFAPTGELFLGQNESLTILRYWPEGQGFKAVGRVELPKSSQSYLVFSMCVDARGYLWAGTSEGVVRYHLASGQVLRWTSSEGMPNNDCNAMGIFPEPNGDVWLSTAGGIGHYLGSRERPAVELPAPLITAVMVGGESKRLPKGVLPLGPRPGTLEFQFQSLHFGLQGRIRYQVRISGYTTGWEVAEGGTLTLRGLAPGDYTLEIRGVLPEGLRSPITRLSFSITPAWWQTGWAKLAALSAMVVLVVLGVMGWSRRLRRSHQALERTVAERTDEVTRINTELLLAREIAERANRSKSVFLANMSHELRTPLNAILLYCDLLAESAKATNRMDETADIHRIQSAGNHLLTLINGLLDLAKIESGRMPLLLESVPLDQFLEEALATVRPLAKTKGNALVLQNESPGLVLRSDPTKLRQVLFNLISNASKFTTQGEITVRATMRGDRLLIDISDTGIGMTQEQMGRVFQAFVQAEEDTSRKFGGTGLGLTISQKLIELMGGTITVESEPERGTTFSIDMPIEVEAKDAHAEAPASSFLPSDGGRSKALLIDGDALHRDVLSRLLGREGFWVATASGGEEGFALASQILPRLLILSLDAAAADQWALLTRFQQDADLGGVPVLIELFSEDGERGLTYFAPELLHLPKQSAALADRIEKRPSGAASRHLMAMCANRDSMETLTLIAERHQWTIECFDHAVPMLAMLRQHRPDLVLVDLGASTEAWMVMEEMQQNPVWRTIPLSSFLTDGFEGNDHYRSHWNAKRAGWPREEWNRRLNQLLKWKGPSK